ncbi:MAG: hypothetical protein IK012_11350 [Fibrobacter sp.]|uniref:hypothetical protein n=1 Tax=Fibrobacter sp. TaxID=35828 RepID=UPI0025B87F91|nr:hypothetical protein [Fibrobacter sp.]MBR4785827.1 hypothetical protein [Fibrobacter sp.]
MKQPLLIDANCICDMLSIGKMGTLLSMKNDFFITKATVCELEDVLEPKLYQALKKTSKMIFVGYEDSEMSEIYDLRNEYSSQLTFIDVINLFCAKKNKLSILTSDCNYLEIAKTYGVEFFSILDALNYMVEENFLTKPDAAICLTKLMVENKTLPKKECEEKIKVWK